jgi:hypothetical protein
MTRLPFLLALALVITGVVATSGRADGLPVLGVDAGASGVATQDGSARYVTLETGRDTLVARVNTNGGDVLGSTLLRGRFTVPAVAYDGSAAGLSADGRTLVLIRPRSGFPRAETSFAIVDAERLRLRETITLPGDFSFDAISPSGSWLYLVEYLSPRDPSRYLVRLYNLRAGRLHPEPVIDPREVGDVMRGSPITRATSLEGRWAFTLYDGAGEHPFVHALDTTGRTARCIDLHGLMGYPNLFELRLDLGDGGGALMVVDGSEPLAVIDTRTFRVSEPREPAAGAPKAGRTAPAEDAESVPWVLVAGLGLTVVLSAAGTVALRRRPSRPAPRET